MNKSMNKIKQVIVIRKDLKMRRGKEISQGSHSSIAFLLNKIKGNNNKLSKIEEDWIEGGQIKICVSVNSESELIDIFNKAKESNIECNIITDFGLTEFNGVPTKTCLCLGPDLSDKIDEITRNLKLY